MMTALKSFLLDRSNFTVAGLLVILGFLVYMRVGGPVVVAGGLAVAAALIVYGRWRARRG